MKKFIIYGSLLFGTMALAAASDMKKVEIKEYPRSVFEEPVDPDASNFSMDKISDLPRSVIPRFGDGQFPTFEERVKFNNDMNKRVKENKIEYTLDDVESVIEEAADIGLDI